jgi:hypothetical protein
MHHSGTWTVLEPIHICVFFAVWFCFELWFQVWKRQEMPFTHPDKVISNDEFEHRVQKGEQLVILDDLVLDVSGFAKVHPGGAFMLRQTVGRDISKYFYGGYSLETEDFPKPWTHSNMARKVVNSIIVGRLGDRAEEDTYKISARTKINDLTSTITLETASADPRAKLFHKDLSMIGKHFLVRDIKKPWVKR